MDQATDKVYLFDEIFGSKSPIFRTDAGSPIVEYTITNGYNHRDSDNIEKFIWNFHDSFGSFNPFKFQIKERGRVSNSVVKDISVLCCRFQVYEYTWQQHDYMRGCSIWHAQNEEYQN